jgi:hypothetical protein
MSSDIKAPFLSACFDFSQSFSVKRNISELERNRRDTGNKPIVNVLDSTGREEFREVVKNDVSVRHVDNAERLIGVSLIATGASRML